MLYLILPPIVVVTALIVLVYFFSRRFPEVEQEVTETLGNGNETTSAQGTFFGWLKKTSLSVLEYLAQRFKVIALKTYNGLHNWTQSVKEKKKQARETKEIEGKNRKSVFEHLKTRTLEKENEHYAEIEKTKDVASDRIMVRPAVKPDARVANNTFIAQPLSEKHDARNMNAVKETETVVDNKQEIEPDNTAAAMVKSQLEDILVERIAANPRDLEAYERLGEYYMEQGNLQDAKECYRQVIRLSPVHRLAKIKIRRLEKLLEQK